jgi:hypothetical protein
MRRRLRRISDYPLRDILVPLRGDPAAGEARAEGEGEMIPRALTLVSLLIGATAPASAQNKLSWGRGQRSVQRLDQRAQGQLRREYADVIVVARICVGRECNAELQG